MKIKSTISSRVVRQFTDQEGFHTVLEIGFMTSFGVQTQRLLCVQDHNDLSDKKFKPLIREIDDDE
jgi:hypothetical protein